MVKLKFLFIFTLLSQFSPNISLESAELSDEITDEESKKIVIRSKDETIDKKDFQCDLTLLPQQKKLMYFGARSDATGAADVSYDLYRWPKNKEGFVIVPYSIPKSSQYCKLQFKLQIRNDHSVAGVQFSSFRSSETNKSFNGCNRISFVHSIQAKKIRKRLFTNIFG